MMNFIRFVVLLTLAASALLFAATSETTLLRTMPADLWDKALVPIGRPAADGLFGSNRTSATFIADNQRRAMELMLSGIALSRDADVADAWRAIDATYARQTTTGGFGTGTNGSEVESMSFWMGWSNHAIWSLMNSAYAASYQTRITALLSKVELAMDRLMADDANAALTTANLGSPNRSVIMANSHGFASLILANHSSSVKLAAYRQRGKFWIDNVFINDKLFRSLDGVFTEAGGYDTGYQAVGMLQAQWYLLGFPDDVVDAQVKMLKAGQWLVKRIASNGAVDCTYNRRSGPNNASGDVKGTDKSTIIECLMYWSAINNRADGNAAARLMNMSSDINGLPPVVFSPLSTNAALGVMWSYDLLVTNAGLTSLSTAFAVDLVKMPTWLTRSNQYGFSASTGTLRLTGTPPVSGTVTITITSRNEYGSAQPVILTITTTTSSTGTAPIITTQPANQTVTAGQTATITVVASGTGPLSYQWKRGAINVGTNNATLTIANAQAADAGSYTVMVSNGSGNVTSPVITLTVNAVIDTTSPVTPSAPTTSNATSPTPTLSGTTEAGATIRIYDHGILIGTVVANSSGQWTWTANPPLTAGTHQLTVTATDSSGNTSTPSPATIVTVPGPSASPAVSTSDNGGGKCGLGSAVAAFGLALMALMTMRVNGRP